MTIQDLLDALDKRPDIAKLGYLKEFVESTILPHLTEKQVADIQLELQYHIQHLKQLGSKITRNVDN